MIKRTESNTSIENLPNNWVSKAAKLPPRILIAGFTGYYSLGLAYYYEIMAAIDKIAIRIIKHFFGYAGIGAIMPTFQWYAAWGVRITAAGGATYLYHVVERIILAVYSQSHVVKQKETMVKQKEIVTIKNKTEKKV